MLLALKAIAMLILPPGGIVLLAMIGLVFYRRLWGRALMLTSIVLLYALSTAPVRDALTAPLEYASPVFSLTDLPAEKTAIVLLGGGLYEHAPEYNRQSLPSADAMMRTLYAAHIAKKTDLLVYASGGKPLDEHAEAEAMVLQYWLIQWGVAAANIRTESRSKNTAGNAKMIAALLQKTNTQHIILVTSAIHMPRSRMYFEAQGLTVIAAPTKYLTQQTDYQLLSFLPSADVLADSRFALHEYLGLLQGWVKN